MINTSQTLIEPLRGRVLTWPDLTNINTHRKKNKRSSRDTNLSEPTVGGHDLLPLILKHTQTEGLYIQDVDG